MSWPLIFCVVVCGIDVFFTASMMLARLFFGYQGEHLVVNGRRVACCICGRVAPNIVRPALPFSEVDFSAEPGDEPAHHPAKSPVCPGHYIHDGRGVRRVVTYEENKRL